MKPQVSILISSYNRLPLFRRTLWAIAMRKPSVPFEVVVADEGSTEDILGELKRYSAAFAWKFIRVDKDEFEEKTGLAKWHNSPCLTNNIAFKCSQGEAVFLQGNEIIPWNDAYDKMLADVPDTDQYLVMSSTYDLRAEYLDILDQYGSNLTPGIVGQCLRWPLQDELYRSDVTNYISLCSRKLWETIGGYDERYFGGICAEDSDFVRRARLIPGFKQVISDGVSLHQYHGGKTRYYEPKPSVITKARFEEGCSINRAIYDTWDGKTLFNQQKWPYGTYGIKEIISNV